MDQRQKDAYVINEALSHVASEDIVEYFAFELIFANYVDPSLQAGYQMMIRTVQNEFPVSVACDCVLFERGREGTKCKCVDDKCINRKNEVECDLQCDGGCANSKTSCWNNGIARGIEKKLQLVSNGDAGFGVQACEYIAPGEFIGEYKGTWYAHYENPYRTTSTYAVDVLWGENRTKAVVIEPTAKGNIFRFMQHSHSPNCKGVPMRVGNELRIGVYAIKPIAPRSVQLTWTYGKNYTTLGINVCACDHLEGCPDVLFHLSMRPISRDFLTIADCYPLPGKPPSPRPYEEGRELTKEEKKKIVKLEKNFPPPTWWQDIFVDPTTTQLAASLLGRILRSGVSESPTQFSSGRRVNTASSQNPCPSGKLLALEQARPKSPTTTPSKGKGAVDRPHRRLDFANESTPCPSPQFVSDQGAGPGKPMSPQMPCREATQTPAACNQQAKSIVNTYPVRVERSGSAREGGPRKRTLPTSGGTQYNIRKKPMEKQRSPDICADSGEGMYFIPLDDETINQVICQRYDTTSPCSPPPTTGEQTTPLTHWNWSSPSTGTSPCYTPLPRTPASVGGSPRYTPGPRTPPSTGNSPTYTPPICIPPSTGGSPSYTPSPCTSTRSSPQPYCPSPPPLRRSGRLNANNTPQDSGNHDCEKLITAPKKAGPRTRITRANPGPPPAEPGPSSRPDPAPSASARTKREIIDEMVELARQLTVPKNLPKNKKERPIGRPANEIFRCGFCGEEFKYPDKYRRHLEYHLNAKDFPCKELDKKGNPCTYVGNNQKALNEHIKLVHTPDDERVKYLCRTCRHAFKKGGDVNKHMRKTRCPWRRVKIVQPDGSWTYGSNKRAGSPSSEDEDKDDVPAPPPVTHKPSPRKPCTPTKPVPAPQSRQPLRRRQPPTPEDTASESEDEIVNESG